MVKQYLEKTRDEFYDSKYALIEKLTAAENHFKENIKIIQMLEGKSDESFEAFTPREINSYNKSKAKELKEEQKLIEPQIKSLHKQILILIARLMKSIVLSECIILMRQLMK